MGLKGKNNMANMTHKKTLTEKISLKGVLSNDGTVITISEKDFEKEINVLDYIKKFSGEYVELSFQTKQEDDLISEDLFGEE